MTPELQAFMTTFGPLPAEALAAFGQRFRPRLVRKGEVLLPAGEVCRELLFVQSGCLRTYYLGPNGVDISVWFSFAGYLSSELTSFLSGQPSSYAVEAIAESEVLYLPRPALYELYDAHPALNAALRRVWEYVITNVIRRFTALQHDTAEQRYRDLLRQPGYLQQIPQKYLASYIGVTPSSLSRIRKKLA